MTKVLQIVPSLNTINGGVERGTLDVAKKLIEKGFHSEKIGRAHVRTPVTEKSRMPSSA